MPKSPVCVDASVVVALVTAERFSRVALGLWQEWIAQEPATDRAAAAPV